MEKIFACGCHFSRDKNDWCAVHEAAPELLKALKGVMEFYPNAIGFSDENGAYLEEDYFRAIDAEDKAEQALAKAEGT